MISVSHAALLLPPDLEWWVLPRSTTWFSSFVMFEFDDEQWMRHFRMTKQSELSLAAILRPHIEKLDTNYRPAIPIMVKACCVLYKLTQGASLMMCEDSFDVGKSTVCEMLRDVVKAINVELRHKIEWPNGNHLLAVMEEFRTFCSLPGVVGAIDGTHFKIRKPPVSPEDYYYFKSSGFTIQCQVVVDRHRRFLDVSFGMSGSTHDVRVLKWSALYHFATNTNLFDAAYSHEGFSPYLIGDGGNPLLPWLMTPHRNTQNEPRTYEQGLFNHKLSKGRSVVENAFEIFKQCFRELRVKFDLHVTFPDIIVCCCLLHNLILGQSPLEVLRLLQILQEEAWSLRLMMTPSLKLLRQGLPIWTFLGVMKSATCLKHTLSTVVLSFIDGKMQFNSLEIHA